MTNSRSTLLPAILAGLTSAAFPIAALARSTIFVETTIQAAVDAASSGDTIVVPPGTYHETVVVDKDGLTIRGSVAAILDASGHEYGMRVGTGEITGDPPVCPPLSVHDFTLDGLTIRNSDDIGIFLIGVDGFHVTHGRYLDNAEYGVFPRCSQSGLIDHNSGGGGEDATVYVGVDDGVVVEKNDLRDGEIGIELENTLHSIVRNNHVSGNVAGILVVVLPGLPRAFTDDARIEDNVIDANNLPNPFPPPPPFFDDLQLLPSGTGILNVGGDHVVIRNNVVNRNNSVGVALIENPFGFGPPDDNVVEGNVIMQNGKHPDPRSTASGDIVYDGNGSGNCFADNVFKTEFPPGITSAFACP
ncbi:MAG TPA: parallel beta-helix domain-containing protein [Myxococcota bacterium]|nr:parallel beta-helix domain-containing protein [Myxococcota bacterium]